MPNHVTSKITVTGPEADVAAFKALMIRQEPELYGPHHEDPAKRGRPTGQIVTFFDFNGIIPMPAIINETTKSGDVGLWLFALGHTEDRLLAGLPPPNPLTYPWVVAAGITSRDELLAWLQANRPAGRAEAEKAIEAKKETGHQDWDSWSCANWGTKWNAYSFHLHEEAAGRLVYTHDTAWSFPEPIYEALAERFPSLRIYVACFDEGWNFAGRGCFNPGPDDQPFDTGEATDQIYEEVYGSPPERFDDEEPEVTPATA
jgi:hypothetical protein